MPFAPSLSLCLVVSDMFGGGQSLTWRPHWCFALMRLFGSRGACRRHHSCALGVSKRFGAVSGHLPVVTIQVLCCLHHHCRCVWWLATCLGVGSRLPGGLTGVLRLFGSRGACRRHRSCALGVSKRFGAVSGHLPVARSVFFGKSTEPLQLGAWHCRRRSCCGP